MSRLCGREGCGEHLKRREGERPDQLAKRRYCSLTCANRHKGLRITPPTKTCPTCKKEFGRREGERMSNYKPRRTCSDTCARELTNKTKWGNYTPKPRAPRIRKQAKPRTETPKLPPKPLERVIAPPRALPNPVKGEVFTVSLPHPLPGEVRCEIHLSEKVGTFGCSACNVGKNWAKNQPKARPGSGPKIWTAQ